MSQLRDTGADRRKFLRHALRGAALGGAYLAFGDVAQALAWSRRLHWVEPTIIAPPVRR